MVCGLTSSPRATKMGMDDKLSAPPDFDGPVRNRKCTDIIFLVAIVAMWIAMTAVGIASVREVRTIRCEYSYSSSEHSNIRVSIHDSR